MNVIKSTGERVKFDPGKIRGTLRKAGATPEIADRVAHAVSERITSGMPTRRITGLIREQLRREHRALMYRYTLREALLKLGPAGFQFEKYVAAILHTYGYRTEFPQELQGACVRHEVDIIAEKDGKKIMIEAKFRNDFAYFVRLKDVMATWARFLDLQDGAKIGKAPVFNEVWIVTNGKISNRSQKFGTCKGVRMIGWNYPAEESLASYVDHTALYPITVLHELKPTELELFSRRDIMLCREAAGLSPKQLAKRTGLSEARADHIISACRQVIAAEGGIKAPHPLKG